MTRTRIITLFLILSTLGSYAEGISYTRTDSIKVVSLIKKSLTDKPANPMLFFGHKLLNVPYVAHTLEVNSKEQLVVNLRQLDCTTFVESVLALSLTHRDMQKQQTANGKHAQKTTTDGQNKKTSTDIWKAFCTNLSTIRYANGKPEGYPSRNHYFLWWAERNKQKGIVSLPIDDLATKPSFLKKQTIAIDWMTTHSDSYKMLKGNSKDIAAISKKEKESEGKQMYYLPSDKCGLSKKQLSFIHDGDILAIATKKKGLDTTHIGIAEWGKDGKLHLLNASQIHKKVVLEPMTLQTYMKKRPNNIGIWVLHAN